MKYFHALKGSVLALIGFVLIMYFLPARTPVEHIDLVLTISTFLFAILAGFFIARLNSRYDKVISYISDEDSYWLSLYRSARVISDKFANKIGDIIDMYYIVAFTGEVGNFYYKDTTPYLEMAYNEIYKLKLPASKNAVVAFEKTIDYLTEIEKSRNQSAVYTRDRLTVGQWLVLFSLSGVIIFCMLFLELPPVFGQILTVILSTILILVLLIIRDLQNLRLGGYALSIESGQEVFECIGKLRYYPKSLVDDGSIEIPKSVKSYRLGVNVNGKMQVKLIKVK